jgi:hypothetical protein
LVFQWMKKLPAKVQDKCQACLGQPEDFGYELRRLVAGFLRDGIHKLRPSCRGVHYRILYWPRERGSRADTPALKR